MNCGFEVSIECKLLNTIIADAFEQFWNIRKLFIPVMRESKLLNVHHSEIPIYGVGPQIYTYGDLIQKVTMLDFILRHRLGNFRDEWKMKNLPAEYIEQILSQDEFDGRRFDAGKTESSEILLKEKNIINYVFGDHFLGK